MISRQPPAARRQSDRKGVAGGRWTVDGVESRQPPSVVRHQSLRFY
jgi:hypothetical protein